MGWLWRGWNGEEDLWGLIWIWGVLLVVICYAARIAVRLLTDIDIDSPASAVGGAFRYLEIAYSVWMMISLWNCAFNTSWKLSAYLIRLIVLVYAVVFCFLSYTQKRALTPEEMFATANAKLLIKAIHHLYVTHVMPLVHGKFGANSPT